jgi:hypothetical protein
VSNNLPPATEQADVIVRVTIQHLNVSGTMRLGGRRTVLQVRCVVTSSIFYNQLKQDTEQM